MDTLHLFAGGGGGLYADLILGHNPIGAIEYEPYQCELLRQRRNEGWWPDLEIIEGDIAKQAASHWKGRVDCLHAGFPCQDISVAGKGAGIQRGNRSGLWFWVAWFLRVIRPRYAFLENSPAIVSRGLGAVLGDLAEIGYDARWLVLPASAVGAPTLGRGGGACVPTPTKMDGRERAYQYSSGDKNKPVLTLVWHARMFPTPTRSTYGTNKSQSDGAAVRPSLETMARAGMWPTVCKRDYRGAGRSREERTGDKCGENLSQVLGGKLNPTWVEWLMGFPIGATELKR